MRGTQRKFIMISKSLLLLLAGSCASVYAAEPAPVAPAKPAAPAVANPAMMPARPEGFRGGPGAGGFRDPGMEVLTPEERTKYMEAMKGVFKNPAVLAAQDEARKAQDAAMKAMTKVREARDAAIKAASAEMPAIVEKVEAARHKWSDEQRAKFQRPGAPMMPGAPAPTPVAPAVVPPATPVAK